MKPSVLSSVCFFVLATHGFGFCQSSVQAQHTAQFRFDFSDIADDQFENHQSVPGFELNLDAIRLVQFNLDEDAVWMTERQKLHAKAMGMKYLDITDAPSNFGRLFEKQHFSYPPPNSSLVKPIFPLLSIEEMKTNLKYFSSFRTRYYNSESGRASSEWLLQKIRNYTAELATPEQKAIISVEPFHHGWKQASVIIRIAPKGSTSDPITVLGAHCDSINKKNPYLPAPGADDDGSGTVTILEAYRALLKSKYTPTTPLEFHFYSAEEGGGLGSQEIVAAYEAEGKEIKGMQQYDMTAWVASGSKEVVNIITTGVDTELTEFLTLLVGRYLDIPWVKEQQAKGTGSDHLLWTRAGYQACHAFEGLAVNANNENIHTRQDRIDASHEFSFSHMRQFAKLAVAFAVELSS
ncbi:Peptide hydrolase [Mycena venus]|uniref:Peptide hydrolase n=1 Tax=Mycena venus TaxID=2733690 RepID=A0A8H6YKG3_9AGAR|nr:Peptide hydrolase [Mycena venus]